MPCTLGSYSIAIPSGLAQTVPALEIKIFPEGFEPSASVIGDVRPSAYTPAQFPLVTGALAPRLEWAIACLLTEDEMLQLKALYRWQQNQVDAGTDIRLLWTDKREPTEPEDANNLTRDITDAKLTAYGLTYGFPVVKCTISRPSCQLSSSRAGKASWLCSFSVEEYR